MDLIKIIKDLSTNPEVLWEYEKICGQDLWAKFPTKPGFVVTKLGFVGKFPTKLLDIIWCMVCLNLESKSIGCLS